MWWQALLLMLRSDIRLQRDEIENIIHTENRTIHSFRSEVEFPDFLCLNIKLASRQNKDWLWTNVDLYKKSPVRARIHTSYRETPPWRIVPQLKLSSSRPPQQTSWRWRSLQAWGDKWPGCWRWQQTSPRSPAHPRSVSRVETSRSQIQMKNDDVAHTSSFMP